MHKIGLSTVKEGKKAKEYFSHSWYIRTGSDMNELSVIYLKTIEI